MYGIEGFLSGNDARDIRCLYTHFLASSCPPADKGPWDNPIQGAGHFSAENAIQRRKNFKEARKMVSKFQDNARLVAAIVALGALLKETHWCMKARAITPNCKTSRQHAAVVMQRKLSMSGSFGIDRFSSRFYRIIMSVLRCYLAFH